MLIEGTVQNGVVVLDPGKKLPDGTRVEVVVRQSSPSASAEPTLTGLLELADTVDDLPPDMARNHDHYVHGAARR